MALSGASMWFWTKCLCFTSGLKGQPADMSRWVTYAQAADILGCHVWNVPKLVRKGHLKNRPRKRGALERRQVEQLAEQRSEERETAKTRPKKVYYRRIDHRPDHDHEWLSVRQVAELVGITRPAVMGRIHRERVPAVENGGRY
jgi:hypothetical protein